MMPYLLVQQDGAEEFRCPFDRPVLRVGRSADNDITLSGDLSVSRAHVTLMCDGGRYLVRDEGSRHGTRLNGELIHEAVPLQPGDRIDVGRTVIHFLREPDPGHVPSSRAAVEGRGPAGAGIQVSPSAAGSSGRPAAPDRSAPTRSTGDLARVLGTGSVVVPLSELIAIGSEVGSRGAERPPEIASRSRAFEILSSGAQRFLAEQSLDEVLAMTLDMVHHAARPDRAALMLLEGKPPVLKLRAARAASGPGGGVGEIPVSRTIADAVVRDRQSILTSDAAADPRFAAAESIIFNQVRSAMSVPLWNNESVIGLVYLDTIRPGTGYTREDLQVVTLLANLAAVKIENVRLFQRDLQMRVLEKEMAAAAKIQRRLLPESSPEFPGYAVVGRTVPCMAVGGDYYDMQLRAADRLGLAIGDVSGKGLGAALLMAMAQAAFRAHLSSDASIQDVVANLNRVVAANSGDEQFITFFCAELERTSGRLAWVSAGHNPPLLMRADGSIEKLHARGMALGVMPETPYRAQESTLGPGDILVLYSDGITEPTSAAGEEYGEDRLARCIGSLRDADAGTILSGVFAEVEAFAEKAPQFDDSTLVIVRRERGPAV